MALVPGYHYLGPGNPINNGEPVNKYDQIAQEHDLAYSKATTPSEIYEADKIAIEKFSKELEKNPLFGGYAGKFGLELKAALENNHFSLYPFMINTNKRQNEPDNQLAGPSKKSKRWKKIDSGIDMEVEENPIVQAQQGKAGPGTGAGITNSTQATIPIFIGSFQPPNKMNLTFHKEYRFTIKTSQTKLHPKSATDPYLFLELGSVHDIPWNMLAMYCSPREGHMLRTQFTKVIAKQAQCTVTTLGVRLPFKTNESDTTTANANVQIPIFEMYNIDKYYHTKTNNIENIINKCIGKTVYADAGDGEQTAFTNIAAFLETRKFINPLQIVLPNPTRTNEDGNIVSALEVYYSDPQFTSAITNMINGSNHLGPCFSHTYDIQNGLLFARSTNKHLHQKRKTGNTKVHIHSTSYNTGYDDETNITNYSLPTMPYFNSTYKATQIENQIIGSGKKCSMPRFPIGLYNIRNLDEEANIVKCQWEIILSLTLHVDAYHGAAGVYNRNTIYPDADVNSPLERVGQNYTDKDTIEEPTVVDWKYGEDVRCSYNRTATQKVTSVPNQTDEPDHHESPVSKKKAKTTSKKTTTPMDTTTPVTPQTRQAQPKPQTQEPQIQIQQPQPKPQESQPQHSNLRPAKFYDVNILTDAKRQAFLDYQNRQPPPTTTQLDQYFTQLSKT